MNTDSRGRSLAWFRFALAHWPANGFSSWKSAAQNTSDLYYNHATPRTDDKDMECGGRAERRHRFPRARLVPKAAWRFASRRSPNPVGAAQAALGPSVSICGCFGLLRLRKMRLHLNSGPTSAVKPKQTLGGVFAAPRKAPPENKRRTRAKHERNTSKTRAEHERIPHAPRMLLACSSHACRMQVA